MTDAILNITDGTTTISLINPSSGFHLINWVPAITDYKGGGVFQDSPLADWRQMRVAKWATATENFGLTINGQNPNGVAYMLQELRRLLEKANAYWTTDWQNTPVYIEARAKCETNTRYCLVVKGRLGNDQNYYRQPFTGSRATMRDLPLIIERREWLGLAPGQSTAIAISAVEDYNGDSYGNVDSTGSREAVTTSDVFVANHRVDANITNIHLNVGANIFGSAVPYIIIATGTLNPTYFGIDTSLSNSGPFSSIIFDIGQAQVNGTGGTWEYWDGSTWTALSVILDETNSFTNTGVLSVVWQQPDDWATNSPGGTLPTGYWVRFRFATTPATTAARQQNRQPYSVVWPYVEIQSNIVGGDIPALIKAIVKNRAYASTTLRIQRILAGLRSVSRGEDFTPIINVADEQNPSGIAITTSGLTIITDSESPTGRSGQSTTTGTKSFTATIDETLASQYIGLYHAYLITSENVPSDTTFFMQYRMGSTGSLVTLPTVGRDSITISDNFAIDLGQIDLIPTEFDDPDQIAITVNTVYASTATVNQWFLYLMPIDEFAVDFYPGGAFNTNRTLNDTNTGYLDSITVRKGRNSPSAIVEDSSGYVMMNLTAISNGPFILQSGKRQRLYFLTMKRASNPQWQIAPETIMSIQLETVQRYLSLRGER